MSPHAQTLTMQSERWPGMSRGAPRGTPACPPQAMHQRCICLTSSKPALITGLAGSSSEGEEAQMRKSSQVGILQTSVLL